MPLLKDFINLLLYGNFWIALCAVAMCLQSQFLLHQTLYPTALTGLAFFSTLFLYALHRIVGISRLKDFLEEERYAVIYGYRNHIRIYALVGLLGSIYCFFQVSWAIRLELFVPGLLSLGYVLPFLVSSNSRKRLRDINHVKIFLIAIVWAWVSIRLPMLEAGNTTLDGTQLLLLLEKALFIFAITLPFDIRDLVVDEFTKVKTIPAQLGIQRSKQLAYACLFLAFLLATFNYGYYAMATLAALALSYASTAWLVSFSDSRKHDYFFTGLIDGTMIIQFLLLMGSELFK